MQTVDTFSVLRECFLWRKGRVIPDGGCLSACVCGFVNVCIREKRGRVIRDGGCLRGFSARRLRLTKTVAGSRSQPSAADVESQLKESQRTAGTENCMRKT